MRRVLSALGQAEVRRKASKPEGELTVADLRKVRSVDLTRSTEEIESLDPCVWLYTPNEFEAIAERYLRALAS